MRLLTQLEHLQKALWRHAVTSAEAPTPSAAPLQFSVQAVTEEKVPVDGIPHTPPSLLKKERKKKYQKTGRPHDWRTRKDPFEGEWEQITSWLLADPALTGTEIFLRHYLSMDVYRGPSQAQNSPSHSIFVYQCRLLSIGFPVNFPVRDSQHRQSLNGLVKSPHYH